MAYRELAARLSQLGLEHPPVALSIVDSPPKGIDRIARRAISSCAFWRMAEVELFYAASEDHGGCAVGAHVMGLKLSASAAQELGDAAALMADIGYLSDGELTMIPQVGKTGAGAVYGPLAGFPLQPDCALLWVNPGQAMLLAEALRTTTWKPAQAERSSLFGRPACGAVARSINIEQESLSLGCTGMRTFAEIAPSLALFVIPGHALSTLTADLSEAMDCNDKMLRHYQAKQDAFA